MINTINGTAVAAQCFFDDQYNTQSTEDSGRDLTGYMHNTFIAPKWKLIARWPKQTRAARATLMTAILDQPNLSSLSINYTSSKTNTDVTKTFMIGNQISNPRLLGNDNYMDEVEIHFIEL